MTNSVQNRRLLYVAFVAVLAFFGLGWRLVDLQYLSNDEIRQKFARTAVRESVIPAWRGDILDRNGSVLATSVRHYEIGADPLLIEPFGPQVAAAIAGPLQLDPRTLARLLTDFRSTNQLTGDVVTNQYVVLARSAPRDLWLTVQGLMLTNLVVANEAELPAKLKQRLHAVRKRGIRPEVERETRSYPNGGMGGQILGMVNDVQPKSANDRYGTQVGISGLELVFNQQLSGVEGLRREVRDELTSESAPFLQPVNGQHLVTTIDRRVQTVLERATAAAWTNLGAASVFVTVMDVDTFEVLGTCSAPGFDLSDRRSYSDARVRNRSLVDEFEPGSVFKLIALAGGFDSGVVDLDTLIDCLNGVMPVRGSRPLTDLHGGYGVIPVRTVIAKSSNIGTARIVQMMGHARFYDYMQKFGVGLATGVGLPEQNGRLLKYERYYPVDFTRLPIGYGVRVTQLQLACMYSAVANGGVLKQPRLITALTAPGGQRTDYPTREVRRVISENAARQIIEGFRGVASDGGTASNATLEHHTVAGKTGTAHKYVNGQYDNTHYYSSFYGFFPASDPRICVAVTVDEPDREKAGHYGGKVAGPLFKEIAREIAHYLNIQPDLLGEEHQPAPATATGNATAQRDTPPATGLQISAR